MLKRLSLLLPLALSATTALAEPLVIAAGKEGGGYDKRAKAIAERLQQRGVDAAVINKNGSDEISLAVCGGRADLGIMQIDAIYARTLEGCQMKPVAVYGKEYGFLLFPPGSDKDELSDLTANDTVMIDTIGSGSELFWKTITHIETGDDGSGDEWASVKVSNDPMDMAVVNAELGEVAGVVMVRKADDTKDLARLLSIGWSMGELWDKDINDLQFNDGALYVPEEIEVNFGNRSDENWAYNVRSFIVASTKLASEDRKLFTTVSGAAQ